MPAHCDPPIVMLTSAHLDLPPLLWAGGRVRLPGSKSISNRVLLLAGLSQGTTCVHDVLASDDTRVMIDALRILGCEIESEGATLRIQGLGGHLATREAHLFLGNAGTAMRPLAAALALMSATQGGVFELSGVPRMHERPIADLVDALRPLGCEIRYLQQEGYPPLRIEGGQLRFDGALRVRGDTSSQFLSALLLALPLVASHQALAIEVVGELISKPYVEITLNLLNRFGIEVQREGWQRFTIPAGSRYLSPGDIHVEGDASSASYFIAAGAIAATAEPVHIDGVGAESIQGDIRFVEAARLMGADIAMGPNHIDVRRGAWPLRAIEMDCNHIPDAAMTLCAMALYASGTTRLTHIASWRVKETDRIAAMATELRKLGASVVEGADFIEVTPPEIWRAASVHTYDDHRMAMCFSLAAFNGLAGVSPPDSGPMPLTVPAAAVPVRIQDPQCVAKTFPEYFESFFHVVGTDSALIPVITIDGPTASGKGTLAALLAHRLGFHLLDSGLLYRAVGLLALRSGMDEGNTEALVEMARKLKIRFSGEDVWLDGEEVSNRLRDEAVGSMASKISAVPQLRKALVQAQLSKRQLPGLVADGRDMGTVIFPDAPLKVFLTASSVKRAERRYKQLISKGIPAKLDELCAELEARDVRDKTRSVSPLRPAPDARLLDNSDLSVEDCADLVCDWWQSSQPFA